MPVSFFFAEKTFPLSAELLQILRGYRQSAASLIKTMREDLDDFPTHILFLKACDPAQSFIALIHI